MQLKNLFALSRTEYHESITSKKKVLERIAQIVADDSTHIKAHDVFDALIQRERLGTTGLGHGVAIPHCRLKNLDSAVAVLILLEQPINYDSVDKQPVDIIIAVMVPQDSDELHLELLAKLAQKLSSPHFRQQLRDANSREELLAQLVA